MTAGLRWTPEQYADLLRKRAAGSPVPELVPSVDAKSTKPVAGLSASDAKVLRAARATERFNALGRLPKDVMNGTELEYSTYLDEGKRCGRVIAWRFHPFNVRLAANTFYEVDWIVLASDMGLEIHETKGGRTTVHGQIKIKLCAEVLPFFRMKKVTKLPKKKGGGWHVEDYSA